jgi:lipid-binding SYLF domain-containing protein
MDFKSLISQLDQLNEATTKTKTGIKHTAEPGGYGRKDDEDEEGNKVKDKTAEKKGKGRPKKATSTSGEDKSYDFSAFGVTKGKDVKLPKYDKKKTKKHSIKEYLDQMYEPLNEMGITVKPMPGASQIIGADGKPMGTADAATANTIKQASEKGTLKLGGDEEMKEGDIGKHNNATTGFDALVRKLTPKYGKEAATKIAGSQLKKIKEADMPPRDALASPLTLESKKKPDANKNGIPDYAEDGEGKNDLKKKKDKIDEGIMDKLKGMLVPKLMKLLGPDAEKIASAVKQATGGDFTPSKENAMKVVQALGIDRAANKPEMAEGIAGNWQGKLIQALYTLGLLGAAGASATMWGTIAGGSMAVIGFLLLMFANSFFGEAPGQAGAMGKFGNKGTSAQNGLDDNGMPIRNTNVDESVNKKKVKEDMDSESKTDKKKCPPMSHIKKMCQDGKSVAEICKMHPDCDQKELKQMVADCKKKMVKEGMDQKLNAARSEGKAHGLRGHAHCGKNYEDMEEARCYHEGYKEGLDECYGQMPIQGYVGETTPVVNTMASYGAEEGELAEADIEESPFTWAAKNTPKGSKFSLGGKEFVKNDAFAFEALDKQLNALLEDKEVTEGMTVSISKGQQGAPDSVSVSAQDAEADELLSVIKSAGLGLFGGDEAMSQTSPHPMTVDNGGEPAEIGAGGDAIEVVGDHDGMMSLMKKLSGIGGSQSHDEETCESCGGMMEAGHSCSKDKEMVDEVESEDQMTYQMAEDNPPDSGAAEVDAEDASVSAANAAAAAYNPSQDIDEGGDGGEASDVGNIGVEAGDADEEMQASMNEAEDETGEEAGKEEEKKEMSESSFFSLYKKLAMLSEESTSEKDDKAEKAAKKVAKDIEYDEDHKGKDDDKAEEAGKKVKKDIEYDDKKDKKEKKLDEWANDAGPGKSVSDTTFETDIDFMMNVISGGLNKRKQTGQTTIPVLASQLGRQVSRNTTDINESVGNSSDAVAQWKKLAGLK